ncbi:MAG: ABC transporter ATP-binding protein [Longimicrobiales bacterium]
MRRADGANEAPEADEAPGPDEAPDPSRPADRASSAGRNGEGEPPDASGPAAAAAPALVLEGVRKTFAGGDHPALVDIDLRVDSSEVVAVVGASGCGKTTLLRLVAGLEVPDAGSIRIDGREVAGDEAWVQPEDRGVGLVFQDFALFPHLRVGENVAYGLRGGRRERRERSARMLEMVGLEGLADRYPHQLSGGQKQRVALARALAPSPRILLLDEPFSNMDLPLKTRLQAQLARLLRRTEVPTLVVVHDVEDVVPLAGRVVVLREGRVLTQGTIPGLCRNPGDSYVAGLFERLRSPAGNRFVSPEAVRDRSSDPPRS